MQWLVLISNDFFLLNMFSSCISSTCKNSLMARKKIFVLVDFLKSPEFFFVSWLKWQMWQRVNFRPCNCFPIYGYCHKNNITLLLLSLYSNLFGFQIHQCECNLDWDTISQLKRGLSPPLHLKCKSIHQLFSLSLHTEPVLELFILNSESAPHRWI